MDLAGWLNSVARGPRPPSFEVMAAALDPVWIAMALSMAGVATVRRRKLPVEAAMWLVIGMALFRNESIPAVTKHLIAGVADRSVWALPPQGLRGIEWRCSNPRLARSRAAGRVVCLLGA